MRPTFRQVMDRIHEMLKDAELMGRESLLTLSSSAARLPVYPDYLQVGEVSTDTLGGVAA